MGNPGPLEIIQEEISKRKIPVPGWKASQEEFSRFSASIARIILELNLFPGEDVSSISGKMARMIAGLGILEEFMEEDGVEEIIVRNGSVLLERDGRIEILGEKAPDSYFFSLARRAADMSGRAIRGDKPYVLTDLPGGERFTAIVSPLSVQGTAINIRLFGKKPFTLNDLVRTKTFSPPSKEEEEALGEEAKIPSKLASFLANIVKRNIASILIAGAPSTGKTTLLNALTYVIPPELCLACIETFKELRIAHPYPVRAVVPEKGVEENFPSMQEVVNIIYTRMRPDIIVFGEIVGPEAVPLLDAMNLGKRVLATIHGDSPYDALHRLEMAALPSGLPLRAIQERIARGVNLIIHMARRGKHRFVNEIALLRGFDGKKYSLVTLYSSGAEIPRLQRIEELWKNYSLP